MNPSRISPSRTPFNPSRTNNRFDPSAPSFFFDGTNDGRNDTPPPVVKKSDVQDAVDKHIQELLGSKKANNDPMEALAIAVRQNYALETRAVDAETALENEKKSGLTDADKADLAALRELGIKPGEAKAEVEAGRAAKGEAAESKRLTTLEEAAPVLGYRAAALKRLAPKSEVIVKQIDVKGEDGKVTKENRYFFKDGETEKEISEHFATDPEALELLKPTVEASQEQQRRVVKIGATPPAGSGKAPSVLEQIKERNAAAAEKQGKGKTFIQKAAEAGMVSV